MEPTPFTQIQRARQRYFPAATLRADRPIYQSLQRQILAVRGNEGQNIHLPVMPAAFSIAVHIQQAVLAQDCAERADVAAVAGPTHPARLAQIGAAEKMHKP